MPPKKKANADKAQAEKAATPTPGSATQQDSAEDRENELAANFEAVVDDFTSSSTVAVEVFQDILASSLEIAKNRHIQENTDLFTANAACEALTELTDWLYLSCEEAAELNDFERIEQPVTVEIDAWAENATCHEDGQFGLDKTDEVVDMHKGQRGLAGTVDLTQMQLLPEWLRPESRPVSTVTPSLYSQTVMTPQKRKPRKPKQSTPPKQQQEQQQQSTSRQGSAASSQSKSSESPVKPKAPQSEKSTLSAGRLRQFKRRSTQHKIQKKIQAGPNNRLEPMYESNLPAQFIEISEQEREDRRKAIKNGRLKPNTKSEVEFMKGHLNKFVIQKKASHSGKPKRIPSLRSNNEISALGNNSSITRIGALPETLVDSLAISDGSSLSQSIVETSEFDLLQPVSITM